MLNGRFEKIKAFLEGKSKNVFWYASFASEGIAGICESFARYYFLLNPVCCSLFECTLYTRVKCFWLGVLQLIYY